MNRQTHFNGIFESLWYGQCRGEFVSVVINCLFLCSIESSRTPTASFGEILEVKDGNSRIVYRSQVIQMGRCGCEGRR